MCCESCSKFAKDWEANRARMTLSSRSAAVVALVAIRSKPVSSPNARSASVAASVPANGTESGIVQYYRFWAMSSAQVLKGVWNMAETEADFADLGVAGPIVASLAAAGITHPFPIQALTLPVARSGADIIGQAKTGTGKTLGFGLPLLQRAVGKTED